MVCEQTIAGQDRGRSRGGPTTRIRAVTDVQNLPIPLKLTAGQAHDGRSADDTIGTG